MFANGSKGCVLILLAVLASLKLISSAATIDFKYPVRSMAEDEITSLPGLNYTTGFKHYSGYLEADNSKNRFWHYWFVESRSDPAKDPLVLWLNGGPGCSSLLGLLTELGPYSISPDGQQQLVNNPFSWNQKANVIFMESPAGVGFSYAADGSITADDDSTAQQNYQALKSFLKKFPQYKNRPLYLTGESYGGVYLPTLAVLVDKDPELNLKGVAIGNGYLDANRLAESLVYFSYYHGLIGESIWKELSTQCCDKKPVARGDCHFTDSKRTQECADLLVKVTDLIIDTGLNPYNLYDRCAQPDQQKATENKSTMRFVGREHFDKSLLIHSFNVTQRRRSRVSKNRPKLFKLASLRGDPPCTDDSITINYLNRPDVKTAIHIPEDLKQQFTTCFDGIKYTMIYPGKQNGLMPQMKQLYHSPRNMKLLVYNGDVDMMCNFIGDEWFVDEMGVPPTSDYWPWEVNKQVAGFVKRFGRLTYRTVKGSGHMVPTDKPAEALALFEDFLYGK